MWFNTAACDHPVTLPAPEPLWPPRGPNQSHQTQASRGCGAGRAQERPGGSTQTHPLPGTLSPAPCRGRVMHTLRGAGWKPSKNKKCFIQPQSGPCGGWKGPWGRAQHGGGEGGALPSAPAGILLQGQSAARLWLQPEAEGCFCSPKYEHESRSCSLGWVKPRELLQPWASTAGAEHAACSFLFYFTFHLTVELL